MGDLSEVVMFFISSFATRKRKAVVIMSLCSTFHTIYIAMNCLFAACSEGQRRKHSCGCQKDVRISFYLSHIYIRVSVCLCVCVLWGIMAVQTWLCGRCKFNQIFFFFFPVHFRIWFNTSSNASHMERYWKKCFLHAKRNIYWCSAGACLTAMSVNL